MQIISESVLSSDKYIKSSSFRTSDKSLKTYISKVTLHGKKSTEEKDITTDFNAENNTESVSERTVKRMLHNNQIYRRIVRKRMVFNQINRKKVQHGVYLKEDRLLNEMNPSYRL